MTCNCHSTMKEKLADYIAKSAPEGHGPIDVEIKGYLFGIAADGSMTHRSSNDVAVEYHAPKKGGGTKTVKQKTYVRATYCPFCGLNYETGKPASEA